MNEQSTLLRPARRVPSQDRSAQRRQRISEATIGVIADHGISGVTHRLVAARAGVSLAATTYYYATKTDLIADAARELFADYAAIFRRVADRMEQGRTPATSFRDFALVPVINAAGGNRRSALAWGEIMLGAARQPALRPVALGWIDSFVPTMERIAAAYGFADAPAVARSANDIVVGLLFDILGVGPSEEATAAALNGEQSATEAWPPDIDPPPAEPPYTGKAAATRERIIEAALDILTDEGAAAISLRRVAERASLTPAAPAYYFPSVQALVEAVQERLFHNIWARYRDEFREVDLRQMDAARLAALSAQSLRTEATSHASITLAQLHIRLQAARTPRLRLASWRVIRDQITAWHRALEGTLADPTPLQGLALQAAYVGKLVRGLVSDFGDAEQEAARQEFATEVAAMADGSHWMAGRGA